MDNTEATALAQQTWDAVGFKIRPLFAKVFVKTDPPAQKIGLIYLPPKEAQFFGGLGHMRLVTATVIAVGPLAKSVKLGDRVCFRRLDFGHFVKLRQEDQSEVFVGWIEQEQLSGFVDATTIVSF